MTSGSRTIQGTMELSQGVGSASSLSTWSALAGRIEPLLHFAPGAAHAVTTVAVGYPFDTVKTRLQLRLHPGMLSCAKSLISTDGPSALYRGAAMPLFSLVVKRPCEFVFFEWFNSRFSGLTGVSFVGGCFAGVIGAMVGCPFTVVKIQMQAFSSQVHSNTLHAICAVWQQRGFVGFYHGLYASVLMQVPYATVYLGTYGELRERLPKTSWCTAIAGGTASLTTCTLLQPLDTARTLIQARALDQQQASLAWGKQVALIVRQHGILGLWAGWGPAALRALPTSSAAMLVYERVRSLAASGKH